MHAKKRPQSVAIISSLLASLVSTCAPSFAALSASQPVAATQTALPAAVRAVIEKYGGADNIRAHRQAGLRAKGLTSSNSAISSAANTYECLLLQKGDKVRVELDFMGVPLINAYDGEKSWTKFGDWVSPGTPSNAQVLSDELRHGLPALAGVVEPATKIELLPKALVHGKLCDVFRATTSDGSVDTFFADPQTHLIDRCDYVGMDQELGSKVKLSLEYSDYRPVAGSLEPFHLIENSGDKRKGETKILSLEPDTSMDDSLFAMPAESEIAKLKQGPISVPFEYSGNNIIVKARINSGPEQNFIVDTGASQTVISREAAGEFAPKTDATFSVTAGSRAMPLSYTTIPTLSIGDVTIDELPVLVTDVSHIGGQTAGIIGASVLKRFLLTLDFDEKKLTFADPRTVTVPPNAQTVPITPVFGGTAMIVKAKVDDKSTVGFLVDTGAAFNNLPAPVAKPLFNGTVAPVGVIFGIDGQKISIGSIKLKSLKLGGINIANPVFTLSPQGVSPTGGLFTAGGFGILGNPVWSQFRTTIDYRNERLILEPESGRDQRIKLLSDIDHTQQQYWRDKNAEAAIKSFDKLAADAKQSGQTTGEALAVSHAAACYADKYTNTRDLQWLDTATKEFDRANKIANESRNRSIEGQVLAQWALTYLNTARSQTDLSAAESLVAKALQKAPMEPIIYAAFGAAMLRQGHNEEAEKLLDHALMLDPANWDALWSKYKLYKDENRRADIAAISAQLKHYYPSYPDVLALGK